MIKSLKSSVAVLILTTIVMFNCVCAAVVITLLDTTVHVSVAYGDEWKRTQNKWWYKIGSSYAKGWMLIEDKWYYFDDDGWMKTGWLQDGSKKYYLDSSGAMTTGWERIDGKWYYMNSSGVVQVNKWIGDYWVNSDGVMATNSWVDEGQYWVSANGVWVEDALLPSSEEEPIIQDEWLVTELSTSGIGGYTSVDSPNKSNSITFNNDGTYQLKLDDVSYSGAWRCYHSLLDDRLRYYELYQDGVQRWHACFFATSTIPNALIVSDRVDSEHKLYFESVSGTAKSEDNASDSIVQHDWYGTKVRSKSASSWTNIDAPSDANSIRFTNRGTYRLKINGSLNSGTWIFKSEADGERLYELNSYADDAAYIATLDVVNDELIVSGVGSNAGNDMICKIGWLSGELAA